MHAAREQGAVQRRGNKVALVHILRAGHDLHGLTLADVHHAYPHMVGVLVPLHREHLAHDDILNVRVHPGDGLDLLTGDGHDLIVFAVGRLNIYKFLQPFSRNIHASTLLSELFQETDVVFKDHAQVADLEAAHRHALQTDAEGKA